MKVLWLTNTPVGASKYFNHTKTTGGWMSALESYVKNIDNLSLGVCFFYNHSTEFKFDFESVTYYPTKSKNNSFFGKLKSKLFNNLDDSNLEHLKKVIEDFKPDVIQLFGTESGLGEVLKEVNIPHIIHIQGLINPCLEAWFPKGVSQETVIAQSSLKNRILKKDYIGEYYKFQKMALREEKILKQSKNVFGRTKWDKQVTSLYNAEANYFHCDELLRSSFFKNHWTFDSSSEMNIVSTLNPNMYKGLEIVLKTAYLLKNKSNLNFKWTIIGMQETVSLVRVFENIFDKKFKENNVEFAGYLSADELIEKLKKATVFVHPSHIDNSPNSVCEAMLLGMPVIAGNVGGVPSIITDKIDGLLYNSHDPYELANLLSNIEVEQLKKLGKNAKETAQKRHNPDTIVQTIHKTYQLLIAESQQ